MQKVKIVTDSTSDLTPELLSQYDIQVVPLYVRFGDEIFADGVELDNRRLFQKVADTGIMPQTAAPTPEDFMKVFTGILEQGQDVLCICLSSHLSATVQSATIAAGDCPAGRVAVVDSLNLSAAAGLLVVYAAKLAREGMGLEELKAKVESRIGDLRTLFVVDTMEYLYKGGRCSAMQSLMAGVLKIHPMLALKEGKIIVKDKIRGGEKKILERLLECLLADRDKLELDYIAVAGAACPDRVEQLAAKVREKLPGAKILIAEAGGVISSHCGPGTVGVLYMVKSA